MALSILDGNQSATTLSTILSSGQHITAHTVVSLGTQAITDIVNATSANLTNTQLRASAVTVGGTVTVGNSLTISSLPAISGTVTANLGNVAGMALDSIPSHAVRIGWAAEDTLRGVGVDNGGEPLPIQIYLGNESVDNVTTANPLPISGAVTIGSALPAGTNRIGVVTIGAGTVTIGAGTAQIGSVTASLASGQSIYVTNPPSGLSRLSVQLVDSAGTGNYGTDGSPLKVSGTVTIGAGTAQIGSVTASISGTVPISISSVTVGNSVTIGSLPALTAGTAQIGSVTASISNTVVTFYPMQGTTVTNSNFTSTTASTTLVSAVAGRDVLTVFNEGAGNLFISPGATATTISYQVRLSAGDYWECPEGQRSLIHTAVFATAGTARVTEVS